MSSVEDTSDVLAEPCTDDCERTWMSMSVSVLLLQD
jgi:hypothetical protein